MCLSLNQCHFLLSVESVHPAARPDAGEFIPVMFASSSTDSVCIVIRVVIHLALDYNGQRLYFKFGVGKTC